MASIQSQKPSLVIPIELQIRELDAKLLLACLAATRGFNVFLGNQFDIHLEIGNLPVGTYLAKDITPQRFKVLSFIKSFGFRIFGWDEEVLVYYSQELYRKRRIYKPSMALFDGLFAWGNDSAAIWNIDNDTNVPVYITGNPRADLLSPIFQEFFDSDCHEIKKKYGNFILFNSNFGSVNAFSPLHKKMPIPGEKAILTRTNKKNYIADLAIYKNILFKNFLEVIPFIAKNMPHQSIVVRPHPAESHEPWLKISKEHKNVHVVQEGNIINWLKACQVVLHNGCTTAIEASILGIPAVSYQPIRDRRFDPELPNKLSLTIDNQKALVDLLSQILKKSDNTTQHILETLRYNNRQIIEPYISNLGADSLASEMILSKIQHHLVHQKKLPPSIFVKISGMIRYYWRKRKKLAAAQNYKSKLSPSIRQNDFPEISINKIKEKIYLLSKSLDGRFDHLTIKKFKDNIFLISEA